jgi:hypothetical protein
MTLMTTNTLKRKTLGEPTKLRNMVSAGIEPRMAGPFALSRYPNVRRRETARPKGPLQTDQLRSIQETKAKEARIAEIKRQAAARAEAAAKAAAARKALAKKAPKRRKAAKSGRAKKRA